MADDEDTIAGTAGNSDAEELAQGRAERRAIHEADVKLRERAADALGQRVIEVVDRRMLEHHAELAEVDKQPRKWTPPRPADWRGPHHGAFYKTVATLRVATEEEAAEGFRFTWGIEMTERDIEVFQRTTLTRGLREAEDEARRAYTALRIAIRDASKLARHWHGQAFGPATVALDHLWGRLPALPAVDDLPHTARKGDRRVLVENWQSIATDRLGRRLSPREIAELSILLRVGPGDGGYEQYVRRDGKTKGTTPATVLRDEGARLDRSERR